MLYTLGMMWTPILARQMKLLASDERRSTATQAVRRGAVQDSPFIAVHRWLDFAFAQAAVSFFVAWNWAASVLSLSARVEAWPRVSATASK